MWCYYSKSSCSWFCADLLDSEYKQNIGLPFVEYYLVCVCVLCFEDCLRSGLLFIGWQEKHPACFSNFEKLGDRSDPEMCLGRIHPQFGSGLVGSRIFKYRIRWVGLVKFSKIFCKLALIWMQSMESSMWIWLWWGDTRALLCHVFMSILVCIKNSNRHFEITGAQLQNWLWVGLGRVHPKIHGSGWVESVGYGVGSRNLDPCTSLA